MDLLGYRTILRLTGVAANRRIHHLSLLQGGPLENRLVHCIRGGADGSGLRDGLQEGKWYKKKMGETVADSRKENKLVDSLDSRGEL